MLNGTLKQAAIEALRAAQARHEATAKVAGDASAKRFLLRHDSSERVIAPAEEYKLLRRLHRNMTGLTEAALEATPEIVWLNRSVVLRGAHDVVLESVIADPAALDRFMIS